MSFCRLTYEFGVQFLWTRAVHQGVHFAVTHLQLHERCLATFDLLKHRGQRRVMQRDATGEDVTRRTDIMVFFIFSLSSVVICLLCQPMFGTTLHRLLFIATCLKYSWVDDIIFSKNLKWKNTRANTG